MLQHMTPLPPSSFQLLHFTLESHHSMETLSLNPPPLPAHPIFHLNNPPVFFFPRLYLCHYHSISPSQAPLLRLQGHISGPISWPLLPLCPTYNGPLRWALFTFK